jgi:two-component system, NtrC family, sensor kinase
MLSRSQRVPRWRTIAPTSHVHAKTPNTILAWMVVAIALVTGLAYWSEEREAHQALQDFAREQTTLAVSLGGALHEELEARRSTTVAQARRILAVARAIEQRGAVRALLVVPGVAGLVTSAGTQLRSPLIEQAAERGRDLVLLSRPEAAALGLPARTAAAGLHAIPTSTGRFTIIVVATAQTERDRELRARWRLVLGLVVVSAVVLAFGGLAMRKQRQELGLAHELALTTLQAERDERLVRADKLATMAALATGIAHEVSTPLGVILGRAEQLLARQQDERSRHLVEIIAAQTERIHAVIRGFLALARGNQPLLHHCEPGALAQAAVELVAHRFEKANVRLSIDVASQLPKVSCDPRLFEQVLVNLLLNACDACDGCGSVSLCVREETARVTFVVTDDGVGISPDAAERLTEPFFTTKPDGTGLGLAIANEIVKHHGGTLSFGPGADGKGTRAAAVLPALIAQSHG